MGTTQLAIATNAHLILYTLHAFYSILSHCQYTLSEYSLSWNDHEQLCLFNLDSHLASIHNETQYQNALAICQSHDTQRCWIGLNDKRNDTFLYEWSDGTEFNFGTDVSGGVYPWKSVDNEPNNFGGNEHCCEIYNLDGWNDNWCSYEYPSLCNYPKTEYVFNDDFDYERVPSYANVIGIIDILDQITLEFDLYIHSWTVANASSKFTSAIRIGNTEAHLRFPSMYVERDLQGIHSSMRDIKGNNDHFNHAMNLSQWYHIEYLITQELWSVTIDNIEYYNNPIIGSHSIFSNQNIYIGSDEWEAANVTIKDLQISSSNSHDINNGSWNYLCDYNNRFDVMLGIWIIDTSTCELTQSAANVTAVVWMGDSDVNSVNWTDYKIEIALNLQSNNADSGLLFRAQSVSAINQGGQQYYVYLHHQWQKLTFAKFDDGFTVIQDMVVTVNLDEAYILRVEATGNLFDVYLNHKWMFNVTTDVNDTYYYGSVGLRSSHSNVIFEHLKINFPSDNYLYTVDPTNAPTASPSNNPTYSPSNSPSKAPSKSPSNAPSKSPILPPSNAPTQSPIVFPSITPSNAPIFPPSISPSESPTLFPIMATEFYMSSTSSHDGKVNDFSTTSTDGVSQVEDGNGNTLMDDYLIYIIISGIAIVICVLVVLLCFFCRKKRSKDARTTVEMTNQMNHPSVTSTSPISMMALSDELDVENVNMASVWPMMETAPSTGRHIGESQNSQVSIDKLLSATDKGDEMDNEENDPAIDGDDDHDTGDDESDDDDNDSLYRGDTKDIITTRGEFAVGTENIVNYKNDDNGQDDDDDDSIDNNDNVDGDDDDMFGVYQATRTRGDDSSAAV